MAHITCFFEKRKFNIKKIFLKTSIQNKFHNNVALSKYYMHWRLTAEKIDSRKRNIYISKPEITSSIQKKLRLWINNQDTSRETSKNFIAKSWRKASQRRTHPYFFSTLKKNHNSETRKCRIFLPGCLQSLRVDKKDEIEKKADSRDRNYYTKPRLAGTSWKQTSLS